MDENTKRELQSLIGKYRRLNNDRVDFAKVSGTMELPNLCEVQTESFRNFMESGVEEEFEAFFPVGSVDPKLKQEGSDDSSREVILGYVPHSLRWSDPQPEGGPFVAKARNKSYTRKLTATLYVQKPDGQRIQEEVFFGDYPTMTESGTFIINGSERCIVSQIVRSPGAYISHEKGDKTGETYGADIIPQRGTWLEFETDAKGLLNVRIDKQRKVSAITLLRALGLASDEQIHELFGDYSYRLNDSLAKNPISERTLSGGPAKVVRTALQEIYTKLRPGEPVTDASAVSLMKSRFFDRKHYGLGRAGRFKINEKLGIYNRLPGRTLAENLVDSESGEILFEEGHKLTEADVADLRKRRFFESGNMTLDGTDPDCWFHINTALDDHGRINVVRVRSEDPEMPEAIVPIIGTDMNLDVSYVTPSDIFAVFSYMLNVMSGIGDFDDIDNLSNRRVKCVGELLQEHFRQGLSRIEKNIRDRMLSLMTQDDGTGLHPAAVVNIKPLTTNLKDFFNSSQLSQFMDQINPLAELTNKRRLSALGPGGLSRDRASFEVRDVHFTHYGRICPIETPEGQNVGLINNLACYAKIDKYGFITTPYRPVNHGIVDQDPSHVVYLTAEEEASHFISQANVNIDAATNQILDPRVVCRHGGETVMADSAAQVDFIDVSPKQIVSIASACIPFLENDDTTRALLGSNMERQALPLLRPHAPFVGTGMEAKVAHDSGAGILAKRAGVVEYADASHIIVRSDDDGERVEYFLRKFAKSNQSTCINQTPIVSIGQHVEPGQVIADGPAMENGDLALGQNATIAFMTWHGYDYEDAVVMNEELRRNDTFTSIHIDEFTIERRKTKLGDEEFTRDVPNAGRNASRQLDARGIIIPGSVVNEGDVLVGKITPKGETQESPEEKLLKSIFSEKAKDGKDSSLKVPHGCGGIVQDVQIFSAANGDVVAPNVIEQVKVHIVQKRKISEGDKMSGRHGNKGVISKLVPQEDMPFLPDGRPVDLCLNPLGVPSRMNIGQVIELHLGEACRRLGGLKLATPVFDGVSDEELTKMMELAGISMDGKTVVYDGQTGEPFENRIAVGTMYMIKLDHMVDDKMHSRATGPYSLVTQQPLGGKAQNGGQRFGEMEVWALEAYGASHVLQEMLTIKSDDMLGRNVAYESILMGNPVPRPSMPESFRVMLKELQGLALDVQLLDKDNKVIDMETVTSENARESRRIQHEMRNYSTGGDEARERTRGDIDISKSGEWEDIGLPLSDTSSIVTSDQLGDDLTQEDFNGKDGD